MQVFAVGIFPPPCIRAQDGGRLLSYGQSVPIEPGGEGSPSLILAVARPKPEPVTLGSELPSISHLHRPSSVNEATSRSDLIAKAVPASNPKLDPGFGLLALVGFETDWLQFIPSAEAKPPAASVPSDPPPPARRRARPAPENSLWWQMGQRTGTAPSLAPLKHPFLQSETIPSDASPRAATESLRTAAQTAGQGGSGTFAVSRELIPSAPREGVSRLTAEGRAPEPRIRSQTNALAILNAADPGTLRADFSVANTADKTAASVLLPSPEVLAPNAVTAVKTWTGAISNEWGENANWSPSGKPGNNDVPVFNNVFVVQPAVLANTTVAGLWMTGDIGQNVVIAGPKELQISNNTGFGIQIDNTNSFTLTINAALKVQNPQTWANNSNNLFTVGGEIDLNNRALTVSGAGSATFSGKITGSGAVTKTGSGTLTLVSTASDYDEQLTIQDGTLSISTINNSNVVGVLGKSTLAVILGGATGSTTGVLEYTGETASSTKRFTMATGGIGDFRISNAATNLTLSAVIDGGGVLAKTGPGTLTLAGTAANTLSGTTFVRDGVLQLNKTAGLNAFAGSLTVGDGNGAASSAVARWLASNQTPDGQGVTILGDGWVDLNTFAEVIGPLTMTGGRVTTDTGTLTLGGQVTGNAFTTSATISGNLALGVSNRIFDIADGAAAVDMDISAIVSGTVALTKSGAGTMVFSGANNYSGATSVNAGVLNIQSNTGLGTTAAGTTVANNATLQLQGGITVGNEALSIRGTGASGQTGALVNVSGTNSYSGPITLAAAATVSSDSGILNLTGGISGPTFGLTLAGTGTGTVSSVIGTTSGGLVKAGAGTWTLSGANTYTGSTTINTGILNIQHAAGLGDVASGTTVASGATLQLQHGTGITIGAETLNISGSGAGGQNGALVNVGGTNNYGGLLTLGAAATISSDGGILNLTNAGTITGGTFGLTLAGTSDGNITSIIGTTTGSLTKNGAGVWTLSGANTYSGNTIINAGTLRLGANDRIADASAVHVSGTGVFDLNNFSDAINSLTMTAGSVTTGGGVLTLGGDVTGSASAASASISGNLALGGDRTFSVADGAAAQDMIISAVISGAGKTVTKSGAGTLTFSGGSANTYSGATTVADGVLELNKTAGVNALGGSITVGDDTGAANSAVTRWLAANQFSTSTAVTIVADGRLDLNNFAQTIGGLTMTAGSVTTGSGTLTLGGDVVGNASAASATISGNLAFGGDRTFAIADGFAAQDMIISALISGAGNILTKSGTGTLTLSGSSGNTYNGNTFVTGGTLELNKTAGMNAFGGILTVGSGTGAADSVVVRWLASDQIIDTQGVTVRSDGWLDLNNQSERIGTLAMTAGRVTTGTGLLTLGGTVTSFASATSATISGNLNLGANRTFNIANGSAAVDMNISAAISGGFNLIKSGAGTLALSGANTYGGSTTINAGTLQLGASNALPDTSALSVSGGTLDLQSHNDTVGAVTLSGGGAIIGTGTLTSTATYTLQNGSASATLAGAGAVTKTTASTVTLTGANTLSGDVTVGAGTLILANSGSGALGAVNTVTVNAGGTLLLGADNQINNAAPVNLGGGTFAKGNFAEGGASAAGVGALTLTAAGSILDFGSSTVGVLNFANFIANGFMLTINNWTGTPETVGNGSSDRLIFASNQSSNLGSFGFTGFDGGAMQFDLGNGFFEIVPVNPIPEPSTYVGGLLTLLLLGYSQRRRLAFFKKRAPEPAEGA